MSLSVIIALVLIGLLLLVLEILVIPGAGVAGIFGFIAIAAGIYFSYIHFGSTTGNIFLGSSFVLSILSVYISVRSKTWKAAMLNTRLESKAPSNKDQKILKGDRGIAVSRLAPAGTAVFGGVKCEVHTLGEYVDPDTQIEIIKIDQQKIFVKPLNE